MRMLAAAAAPLKVAPAPLAAPADAIIWCMIPADEYLRRLQDPLYYGEQDENGVDLSLIRENLKLTPEGRLLRGDRARRSALELLEYGRRQREHNAAAKRSEKDCDDPFA
jgi:hypothetical protein